MAETIHKRDEALERAMEFAKHHRPSGGLSNLYVITLSNNDGTVVDEKYGMNMMTSYGMEQYFVRSIAGSVSGKLSFDSCSLYVGQGGNDVQTTPTIDPASSTLIEKIPDFTGAASVYATHKDYAYPLYYKPNYDGVTGLVTAVMKYRTYRISAQKPDGSDFVITEYGLGYQADSPYNHIDHLWTHSWIYDSNGDRAFINRKSADNIDITVYLCYSYYESLITDSWSDGVYPVITSLHQFMNNMLPTEIASYKINNTKTARSAYTTQSLFINNIVTREYTLNEFTLTKTTADDDGYIDGFMYTNTQGFLILNPELLQTPEAFNVNNIKSYDIYNANGFSKGFGTAVATPFTRCHIDNVYAFDITTNDWTYELDYYNADIHDYNNNPIQHMCGILMYYSNNTGDYVPLYVYQNIHTDDPITAIQTTCETVYAASKYWDKSTWHHIQNYRNIPVEYRNLPYWITVSNATAHDITPVRNSQDFHIVKRGTSDDGYSTIMHIVQNTNAPYAQCSNYDYKWFALRKDVYVCNQLAPYNFSIDDSSSEGEWYTYDRWCVFFRNASASGQTNSFMLCDMNDALNNQPTPIKVTTKFTTSTLKTYNNCFRTFSETGIICLQHIGGTEANIIDIRNSTFDPNTNQYLISASMSTCIRGTAYVAYIDSTDGTKLRIYDVDTGTDVSGKEYTLPGGLVAGVMYGHTRYVWVSNGTQTWVLDITKNPGTTEWTQCDIAMPFNTNNRYMVKFTSTDDMFIIYTLNDYKGMSINVGYCITDPSVGINTASLLSSLYEEYGNYRFDLFIKDTEYTDTNNVKHVNRLLFEIHGYSYSNSTGVIMRTFDLGQYMNNGTSSMTAYERHANDGFTSYILYGDYVVDRIRNIIPIETFMSINIIGTTTTISTVNTFKNVKDKKWSVTFTNIPTFGDATPNSDYKKGKIPGNSN